MGTARTSSHARLRTVPASADRLDATDARLLLALAEDPRATVLGLSQRLGLARNTVQARLARLEAGGVLDPFDLRVRPESLGYRLTAYVTVQVVQTSLADVGEGLARIPEVVLAIPGVQRTDTNLALRRFVGPRMTPLLERSAGPVRPESAEEG
jgi:DNA-binding Lrp family transcriptional regulator